MSKNSRPSTMYGISRIDDVARYTHAWRVSIRRRGILHVKNFPDKKSGGKRKALRLAKNYRDELLVKYPPLTRVEFCATPRRHNRSGITGAYRYAKSFTLNDGRVVECWYWEATWPTQEGKSMSVCFSVKQLGEREAKKRALAARQEGMAALEGLFWASKRGQVTEGDVTQSARA